MKDDCLLCDGITDLSRNGVIFMLAKLVAPPNFFSCDGIFLVVCEDDATFWDLNEGEVSKS